MKAAPLTRISIATTPEAEEAVAELLLRVLGQTPSTYTDAETGEQAVVTREMTGAELLARVRQFSIDNIKAIVMAIEAEEAAQAARDAVTAVAVE